MQLTNKMGLRQKNSMFALDNSEKKDNNHGHAYNKCANVVLKAIQSGIIPRALAENF